MSFQLNARQEKVYNHRCDVWRRTRTVDPETKLSGPTQYQRVLANVPCRYSYTQNDSDPSGIGRRKRRTALTEDELRVTVATDIRNQDFIVDVTPGRLTSVGANRGIILMVMGQPRTVPDAGRRTTNTRFCELFQTDNETPAEILNAYAGN